MKLILVRHGETEENVKGIMQGHLPGKLTANGIKQAKQIALRLKDEKIDAIYSSDLARAVDTAKEIIKYHKNAPVYYVKELRERFWGVFQGKPKTDTDLSKDYKSIEPKADFNKRVSDFIDAVFAEHKDDSVLFVTHGGFIFVTTSFVTGRPYEELRKDFKHKNTALSIFEFTDKDKSVVCLNCDEHLH